MDNPSTPEKAPGGPKSNGEHPSCREQQPQSRGLNNGSPGSFGFRSPHKRKQNEPKIGSKSLGRSRGVPSPKTPCQDKIHQIPGEDPQTPRKHGKRVKTTQKWSKLSLFWTFAGHFSSRNTRFTATKRPPDLQAQKPPGAPSSK
jgi:hypothetical protein